MMIACSGAVLGWLKVLRVVMGRSGSAEAQKLGGKGCVVWAIVKAVAAVVEEGRAAGAAGAKAAGRGVALAGAEAAGGGGLARRTLRSRRARGRFLSLRAGGTKNHSGLI